MSTSSFDTWLKTCDFDFWSTAQHKVMPPAFFERWAKGEAVLLDVRTDLETDYVALPFALHIPIDELPDRLAEVPRDKLVATFCSGTDRANVAFAFLRSKGYDNVRILKGGYAEIMAELLPDKLRKFQ